MQMEQMSNKDPTVGESDSPLVSSHLLHLPLVPCDLFDESNRSVSAVPIPIIRV